MWPLYLAAAWESIQSLAASPLNVELPILDAAGSPAKQVCVNIKHRSGSFNDPAKIREFAARVETIEEIATRNVSTGAGRPGPIRLPMADPKPTLPLRSTVYSEVSCRAFESTTGSRPVPKKMEDAVGLHLGDGL